MVTYSVATYLLLGVLSWKGQTIDGFPNGSPYTTCVDRMPHHYLPAQDGQSPFTISLSQNSYSPNDEITVTITSATNLDFKGFVMTINRKSGDTEELLGQFVNIDTTQTVGLEWYPATAGQKNCITHNNANVKKSVSVRWKAPPTIQGDLVVQATVAVSYEVIWQGMQTTLTANQAYTEPLFPEQLGSTPAALQFSDCGSTQGCFLYPPNCSPAKCQVIVAYKVNAAKDEIFFRIEADGSNGVQYVSLGFSPDQIMGMEPTVTCVADETGSILNVANGYNPGQYNARHRITGFKNINLARADNRISCSFSRPAVLEYDVYSGLPPNVQRTFPKPNLANESNYLFVAVGPLYDGTPSLDKHKLSPLISKSPFSLKENIIIGGSSIHLNLKIHATLALLGWMALVSTGIIVARHYRKVLHKRCCGTAVWFNLHRGPMILGVLSSIAAIVVIFVHVGTWTQSAQIHAILGLTAVGLSLIQVLGGLCRPGLDSNRRRYFNWLHRMAGVVAYMVAAATVLLGFNTPMIVSSLQRTETIIILIWLAFHIFWDLMLEKFPWKYTNPGPYKVEQNGVSIQEAHSPTDSSAPEMIALVIYLLGTCCFVIASLYFLYTA